MGIRSVLRLDGTTAQKSDNFAELDEYEGAVDPSPTPEEALEAEQEETSEPDTDKASDESTLAYIGPKVPTLMKEALVAFLGWSNESPMVAAGQKLLRGFETELDFDDLANHIYDHFESEEPMHKLESLYALRFWASCCTRQVREALDARLDQLPPARDSREQREPPIGYEKPPGEREITADYVEILEQAQSVLEAIRIEMAHTFPATKKAWQYDTQLMQDVVTMARESVPLGRKTSKRNEFAKARYESITDAGDAIAEDRLSNALYRAKKAAEAAENCRPIARVKGLVKVLKADAS